MTAFDSCGAQALASAGLKRGTADRVIATAPLVELASAATGVAPATIEGTIFVESRFRPRSESGAGARGLMQLMPATGEAMAESLGLDPFDPFDPAQNIMAGSHFLERLIGRYGRSDLAHAAYFAGPGRVAQGGPVPPISRGYVDAVELATAWFQQMRFHCEDPESFPPPDFRLQDRGARTTPLASRPRKRKGGGGVALLGLGGALLLGLGGFGRG